MTDLLLALALVLAIEGALYAAAPGQMKSLMRKMQEQSDSILRTAGLISLTIGVAVVWLIRG
jgi:uncharacterized protein YjeT (DUF2065 family)